MARKFTPKVITANHLLDGDVIYLTKDGNWSRNHAAGKPIPIHFREEFRSRGPSNYPDHGKQAEL